MKLCYVKWADANGNGGVWEPIPEGEAVHLICHTVGWVSEETDEAVCLLQTVAVNPDDDDACFNRLSIPKGMILEQKELFGYEVK